MLRQIMAGDSSRDLVSQLTMSVLLLGFILPAEASGSLPSPEGVSYEVIIPKHLALQSSKAKDDETSYVIKVAGTDYIVRLKRKENLLAKDFPVFTYDSKGRRIKSHPDVPVDCYWQGYAEGIPNSLVTLSTCSGLRGFLSIRDVKYSIEPVQGSSTFQHFLYLIRETDPSDASGSMKAAKPGHHTEDLSPRLPHLGVPMYIETFIVVDAVMYESEGKNQTRLLDIVLDIIHLVNTYYSYLRINVVLIGMEVWTNGNLITVSDNIADVLDQFNIWRINILGEEKYDTAHFFLYKHFDGEPGKTYPDEICNPDFSAGVDSHATRNFYLFSKVFAHVLGLSIGLKNDGPTCVCDKEQSCIMHLFYSRGTLFSNCSVETFVTVQGSGRISCLINIPTYYYVFASDHCGDGVVDPGEQCDCGDKDQCQEDPCCNSDCTFKEDVVCTNGPCCYKCKFIAIGKLCRKKMSECDLPEYCTGESEWCPNDVYVQDGTPCNKTAYCFNKHCWTFNGLCDAIFGEGARGAPKNCFQVLNTAGTLFGNCGDDGQGGEFVKCKEKDSMCGRVQCVGVKGVPHQWNFAKFMKTTVGDAECWSIGFPYGVGGDDVGSIPDGTHCGAEKICLFRQCIPLSILNLKVECDSEKKCYSRGVCNNQHNCHCDIGWAPPNCKYFGPGGSIDGGFPLQAWNTELMKLVFGIVIPVGLVVIALVTGLVAKVNVWARQGR